MVSNIMILISRHYISEWDNIMMADYDKIFFSLKLYLPYLFICNSIDLIEEETIVFNKKSVVNTYLGGVTAIYWQTSTSKRLNYIVNGYARTHANKSR